MAPSSPTALSTGTHRIHVLEVLGNAIVGGMEQCVAMLVERLPRERFGVTVLCPFESGYTDRLRALGAEVMVAPISDEPSWQTIQLACALVRASAVDVLHAHLANAHVLAGIVGRLVDKPVLATIHGRQLHPLDLEVHRTAGTHLSVVCRHAWYQALGIGANPKQLHLVQNGVDCDLFAPGKPRRAAVRRGFGLDAETPLVGFVGRLAWEKGPDVFLRTALALKGSVPSAHFVLVGDGPMRAQLEASARQYGVDDRVHFAGLQGDVPAVLGEIDVLVSSSRSEAMPFAIMEAMAAGVPVVACKVGGVPDLIQQGETGWLCDPGDSEGLAAGVAALLLDERARRAAGASARQRALHRFSVRDSIEQTMQLLTRLTMGPAAADALRPIAAGATTG